MDEAVDKVAGDGSDHLAIHNDDDEQGAAGPRVVMLQLR
jgi:hypothetical protein